MQDRLIRLDGTLNFRDVGGYAAADGATVRWGQVYRADKLDALSDRDHETLSQLGLRIAYDLRRDIEVRRAPNRLPEGVEYIRLPMADEGADPREIIDLVLAGEIREVRVEFMADVYRQGIDKRAEIFGAVLAGLADPLRRPAVFHCTAGKDRTGLLAAILLGLLGVDRETIVEDYMLTNEYRSQHRVAELRPRLEEAGLNVDDVLPLITAHRAAIEAALDHVDKRYGGPEPYVVSAAGLQPATVERLRADLTVSR